MRQRFHALDYGRSRLDGGRPGKHKSGLDDMLRSYLVVLADGRVKLGL